MNMRDRREIGPRCPALGMEEQLGGEGRGVEMVARLLALHKAWAIEVRPHHGGGS